MLKPKHYHNGMSLVECLVSVAMSMMVITSVISLLLHNARVANTSMQRRLLSHNTHSVAQMIKHDLYRAGYGGVHGRSIKVSGSEYVFFIYQDVNTILIAYAYLSGELGTESAYTNVVYQQDSQYKDMLRVCETKLPRVMSTFEAANFSTHFGNTCNTLFDSKQIIVKAFEIDRIVLPLDSPSIAILNVNIITALTVWPEKTMSVSFTINPRNP
ncbi:PilW family protein [Vibrio hepatarius]|uniref:PilW family protein n=1 Tax=Vibrio hepatarius TaxID=171383 RepID=UPI001C098B5C|nr:pilus assembly protein PilW [Vibrio hepatarius]MBU2898408.1 pilus assembly protein PilW [Vibrio hepatarius]